jgi:hypothetical protein
MSNIGKRLFPSEKRVEGQHARLLTLALRRNWGLSLILVGWLHLLAFSFCYYLTVGQDYHDAPAYLLVWAGEMLGAWGIFRACGGPRSGDAPLPLELFIRRVWAAYFVLAFNLGSLNTLRGHAMFEFFPAIAPLASFAFLMMAFVISQHFFGAVLVMFAAGLLMAASLVHAYLTFAVAWWLVLNVTGLALLRPRPAASDHKDLARITGVPLAVRFSRTWPKSITPSPPS